jgi:hypothetical protein
MLPKYYIRSPEVKNARRDDCRGALSRRLMGGRAAQFSDLLNNARRKVYIVGGNIDSRYIYFVIGCVAFAAN